MSGIKVVLTTDLTYYADDLEEGCEGVTTEPQSEWAENHSGFVGVDFGFVCLDVLWSSLEIIDEEYLEERKIRKAKEEKAFSKAQNVILWVGPRKGFRSLNFECPLNNAITNLSYDKKEKAEEIIGIFNKYGIKIKQKVVQKVAV